MSHAVLVALALCVPVQAQTPEIDEALGPLVPMSMTRAALPPGRVPAALALGSPAARLGCATWAA